MLSQMLTIGVVVALIVVAICSWLSPDEKHHPWI